MSARHRVERVVPLEGVGPGGLGRIVSGSLDPVECALARDDGQPPPKSYHCQFAKFREHASPSGFFARSSIPRGVVWPEPLGGRLVLDEPHQARIARIGSPPWVIDIGRPSGSGTVVSASTPSWW